MTATAAPARNVRTHSGKVHAARTLVTGETIPACMGASAAAGGTGIHWALDTDAPVTCRRCAGGTRATATPEELAAKKAAKKVAAAASQAAHADAMRASIEGRISRLQLREAEMVAAGGHPMLEDLRAEIAEQQARLA
jgi:hypothetical protein